MQEKPAIAQAQESAAQEATATGMSFDTTTPMKDLKKFQEPARYSKAQFNLKLYKHD